MVAVAKWLLKLYPKTWRVRYEDEMSAVLDDHGSSVRTVADLTVGAMKAHLFWKRQGLWRTQFVFGCAALTFLCMAGYTVVQQTIRQGANFPQQSIVQETISSIEGSASANGQIPSNTVNLKSSLAPFVIIYNRQGQVVGSNASLNGHTPNLPQGVLDYTRTHGVDKLTWQPNADTRIAAVVEPYGGSSGGYVLAGRSLRVVEDQETFALRIAEVAWAVLLLGLSALLFVRHRGKRLYGG